MAKPWILNISYDTFAPSPERWAYLDALSATHDLYVSGLNPDTPQAIYQARENLRAIALAPGADGPIYPLVMNHLIWPWRPITAYLQPGQEIVHA